ncbi:hypothetical protein WA026_015276 [Henosepilachna vigintioctopunctata]|uniref:PHD-type domain-containing protein n=1 Tax=Henosepilachna vigintioctopunctata TaxID=420089 RepID=A0AAW1TVA5_9CUCU
MPGKCSLCPEVNRGNPGIRCQGQCRGLFHPRCVGLTATFVDLSDDSGFIWTCRQCGSITNNNITALRSGDFITKMDMLLKDLTLVKAKFYSDKIDEQMEKMRCNIKTVGGLKHELMR